MEFDPNTINLNTISETLYPILRLKSAVDFMKWFQNVIGNKDKKDMNRKAAWHLYVEMVTRITTQPLPPEHGDEQKALESIHSLFQTTRDILHDQGPDCVEFAHLAIGILNGPVRPFTARWHKRSLAGAFEDPETCDAFRVEHEKLRVILCSYMQALAGLAGVEDFTDISEE